MHWTCNAPILELTATVENTGKKTAYNIQIDVVVYYLDNGVPKSTMGMINAGTLAPFSTTRVTQTIMLENSGTVSIEDVNITGIGFNESNKLLF